MEEVNEQNRSIVTPIYIHSEFEAIWMLLPDNVAAWTPWGIEFCNIGTLLVQDTNYIFAYIGIIWYDVLKIGSW